MLCHTRTCLCLLICTLTVSLVVGQRGKVRRIARRRRLPPGTDLAKLAQSNMIQDDVAGFVRRKVKKKIKPGTLAVSLDIPSIQETLTPFTIPETLSASSIPETQ